MSNSATDERKHKWFIDKADWALFQSSLQFPDEEELFSNNINEINNTITNVIIEATTKSIPKTSPHPKRPTPPWFDQECHRVTQEKRNALRTFLKQHPTKTLFNTRKPMQ